MLTFLTKLKIPFYYQHMKITFKFYLYFWFTLWMRICAAYNLLAFDALLISVQDSDEMNCWCGSITPYLFQHLWYNSVGRLALLQNILSLKKTPWIMDFYTLVFVCSTYFSFSKVNKKFKLWKLRNKIMLIFIANNVLNFKNKIKIILKTQNNRSSFTGFWEFWMRRFSWNS